MGKGTAKISNMRLPATPRPPKLVAEPTAEQLRRFVEDRIGHAMITGRDTTMEEENERLRRRRKPRPDSPERYVAAVRHKTSLADTPESKLKRCKDCRRVAVRGLDVCYFHGGAHLVHQRRLDRGIIPQQRPARLARAFTAALREQALPRELITSALFTAIWSKMRHHRQTAAPMMRECILAWYSLADGDAAPWAAANVRARQLGFL